MYQRGTWKFYSKGTELERLGINMKSYLVEIKNYNNDVTRYIDVIACDKRDARKFAKLVTKVYNNLGEKLGKALERHVDVNFDYDNNYNIVNVVRIL